MRVTRRVALAALPLLARPAVAQAPWPTRPVRIIVPFAAGGPVEIPARFIGDHLAQRWGQPFIVEARPGAGGQGRCPRQAPQRSRASLTGTCRASRECVNSP